MRRLAGFIALSLWVCTAGASGGNAAPVSKTDFLASLGAPRPTPARAHRIQTKSSCTVQLTCDVGAYHISCTSPNGVCQAGSTWVQCDNNPPVTCPICSETIECCDGSTRSCVGWSSCDSTLRKVTCDGHSSTSCPALWQCG